MDLTNVLAGRCACQQIACLGAEVIKVEPPDTGDLARRLGADPALSEQGMGISFLAQNAGKHSITLNLKHLKGAAALRKLVQSADVLVENFRPGVMARLGLDYGALKAHRPERIYCAVSGFGQDGPLASYPAYDQIIQVHSGVMSVTGPAAEQETEDRPTRVGYPLCDTIGGQTEALAISAALSARPRGAFIDVSMLEATLATLGRVSSNDLIGGVVPRAQGNENPTSAPSGTFQAADAPLNIAANKDAQGQALARALGRKELLSDPRFATREARKTHRHALCAELECALTRQSAAHWVETLTDLGIPAGPVLNVTQALAHPQIETRAFLSTKSAPGLPEMGLAMSGFRINHRRSGDGLGPPPRLGADTARILAEIGYSDHEIADLSADGAI